ncbi:MAG: hydrogenase, partial [Syntrophales bacterium]
MKGSDEYSKAVSNHYKQLMEYCKINQERLDRELPPPREDLSELLAERGVSRRDFIKWTSIMTSALMLPPMFRPALATAAENFSRLPIAWLHFAECTGCTEAFLRTS